jgi:hypothetical protein
MEEVRWEILRKRGFISAKQSAKLEGETFEVIVSDGI